jgi:hypothetical protein
MRWTWIALIGLVAGCHSLPRGEVLPTNIPAAPRTIPDSTPAGVLPETYLYRPADRSRVTEPLVRLAAPRRRSSALQTVSHRVAAPTAPREGTIGHGDDYRWLLGRIYRQREGWMIRYAPPGSPDRHDGNMELLFPEPMDHLKEGTLLRVEGDVLDPAPHEIQPAYRVRHWSAVRR